MNDYKYIEIRNQDLTKVGILVDHLGPTQLAYFLIRGVNEYIANRVNIDIVAFYDNITLPCLIPLFANMQSIEINGFDGVVVATSFNTAKSLINCFGPKRKIFYIWDLEWNRNIRGYEYYANIVQNNELELICRNKDHANLIENNFNRTPKTTIDNINISDLIQFIQE